jgi:hypothetical protein
MLCIIESSLDESFTAPTAQRWFQFAASWSVVYWGSNKKLKLPPIAVKSYLNIYNKSVGNQAFYLFQGIGP